ncbi:hypothetical protein [Devosia psychrophila]|nr:hypothetical protein [Devosia psychrophila]KKC33261.1 hypothetical protein WH91_09485 [Devosia psychrophila]
MTRDEADAFYRLDGPYNFAKNTSYIGAMLSTALAGGRNADPNVSVAMDRVEELERRLVALFVVRAMSPAPTPETPRTAPPSHDMKALLSDAGKDARYVKRLLQNGAAMSLRNVPETLRIVQALRPKLAAIWAIYDTTDKPERIEFTPDTQVEFWRRLEAGMSEADALR